jgi:hypothetical protein
MMEGWIPETGRFGLGFSGKGFFIMHINSELIRQKAGVKNELK